MQIARASFHYKLHELNPILSRNIVRMQLCFPGPGSSMLDVVAEEGPPLHEKQQNRTVKIQREICVTVCVVLLCHNLQEESEVQLK